jgi:tRNA (cmo5U34)-methyltransferase
MPVAEANLAVKRPLLSRMSTQDYRWNQAQAAADYDAAAPVIHPRYVESQDSVLAALAEQTFASRPFHVVDLGGGSGRLVERVLATFSQARATVLDQSQPFLDIARQRVARFNGRAKFVTASLQSDWRAGINEPIDAVMSTSAIHHLLPEEKQRLFSEIFAVLPSGGVFINGDEARPAGDVEFRAMLEAWRDHMESSVATGAIPATFGEVVAKWTRRNLDEFGAPLVSGNDCLETVETQVSYLRAAGFEPVSVPWQRELWATFVAVKPSLVASEIG